MELSGFDADDKTHYGFIMVTMNYDVILKTGKNPSDHEQVTRQIPIHKIEVFCDKVKIGTFDRIESEETLLLKLNCCETILRVYQMRVFFNEILGRGFVKA